MGVGVSLSGLASAVAEVGGIGVIASVGIGGGEADFDSNFAQANKRALMREIRQAKAKSSGIIGVNVMAALNDFATHIEGAVEAQADVVFIGAGLPVELPHSLPLDALEQLHTKFVPIVSSGRAAKVVLGAWARRYGLTPPAVVVEGPLAGGHLGFTREQLTDPHHRLEQLVLEVLAAVSPFAERSGKTIAVIAAGGVYTGMDLDRLLRLGAAGVQLATRFIATHECDVDIAYKEAIVQATEEDIVIIQSPLGLPGRAIRNTFLDEAESGRHRPTMCKWKCLKPCNGKEAKYCLGSALLNAQRGRLREGFAFTGANAHRVKRICSVSEVFREIIEEYAAAQARSPEERDGFQPTG
jgi:NAD(P)H-dependent flavin oxidoreductase YrpB (nitropropane dioxygenase family)